MMDLERMYAIKHCIENGKTIGYLTDKTMIELADSAIELYETLAKTQKEIETIKAKLISSEGLTVLQQQVIMNQSDFINGRNYGRTHT